MQLTFPNGEHAPVPFVHGELSIGSRIDQRVSLPGSTLAAHHASIIADRRGLKSIALPAISTGVFGFPMERAARVMLTEVQRFLQGGTKLERVVICLRGEEAFEIFKRELRRGFR